MYVNRRANRKQQAAARTRTLLERAARGLFEARGYAAVSAEQIVAAAGVTRGALYHHYDGKMGLFEAVAEAAMRRLHANVAAHAGAARDPLAALRLGMHRFLELATAPRLQRVLFIDAPSVLGWQRWRALDERYGLGLLKQGIALAIKSGQLREQSIDLAAHILLSALIESAMVIARSDNKARMRNGSERLLLRLLDGLA